MSNGIERRARARVAAPLHVTLSFAGREAVLPVRDVSLGGIFLYTGTPPGPVGTRVTLTLAVTAGIRPVKVDADIARLAYRPAAMGGGVTGMGLVFVDVDAALREELGDLLDRAMLGPGTEARAYPRVYFLLEVACRTKEELRSTLLDIGEGGLGMYVDKQLARDEEITVSLPRTGAPDLLFSGWVASCEPVADKPATFRVGVRFARLSQEQRGELRALLRQLYRK